MNFLKIVFLIMISFHFTELFFVKNIKNARLKNFKLKEILNNYNVSKIFFHSKKDNVQKTAPDLKQKFPEIHENEKKQIPKVPVIFEKPQKHQESFLSPKHHETHQKKNQHFSESATHVSLNKSHHNKHQTENPAFLHLQILPDVPSNHTPSSPVAATYLKIIDDVTKKVPINKKEVLFEINGKLESKVKKRLNEKLESFRTMLPTVRFEGLLRSTFVNDRENDSESESEIEDEEEDEFEGKWLEDFEKDYALPPSNAAEFRGVGVSKEGELKMCPPPPMQTSFIDDSKQSFEPDESLFKKKKPTAALFKFHNDKINALSSLSPLKRFKSKFSSINPLQHTSTFINMLSSIYTSPPLPISLDKKSSLCGGDLCQSDKECGAERICCFNGCAYTCVLPVQQAPYLDWLAQPKSQNQAEDSWLLKNKAPKVKEETCSTEPPSEGEDALLCPHGFKCFALQADYGVCVPED